MQHYPLPAIGYLRLNQIVGDKKAGIPAIIPVSKSTWWAGVKTGRYPQPVKLSERCTAWRVVDIRALIEQAGR
jgi:prophage regulatory protein